MDQRLYERRVDSLQLHSRGIPPSVWTQELAQKYNCFADTVWRDWNQRHRWLPLVARMRDSDTVMEACIHENLQVKKACWQMYHQGDNDNAKVAALKLIVDINARLMELVGRNPVVHQNHEIKLTWLDSDTAQRLAPRLDSI